MARMIVIRYNPHRKRYFLKQGNAVVGTKNGYDNKAAAEKARLQATLGEDEK